MAGQMRDKKTIKCDVLVIGAGPAGASAALFLSEKGLAVVLVDKKAEIDQPLRCAEFIPLHTLGLLPKKTMGDYHEISVMKTHVCGREFASTKVNGALIDRPVFLQRVLAAFQENGGVFYHAHRYDALEEMPPHWGQNTVSLLYDKKGARSVAVKSRMIVCAEGAFSKMKSILKIRQSDLMPAVSQNISQKAFDLKSTHVFFDRYIKAGYGWLFPKKESINIGIGAESKNIRARLEQFKKDLTKAGFIDASAKVIKSATGLIPVSAMMAEPVVRKIVFAGDAANLCHPVTGAGIYPAVLSAKICACAVAKAIQSGDAAFLCNIKKGYESYFLQSLQRAYARRRLFSERFDADQEKELSRLVSRCWISSRQYYRP
jgi:digeranylgeranylglycerophospholipid reductase